VRRRCLTVGRQWISETGPTETIRRPAQRGDPARRGRRDLYRLRGRRARARHRRRGRRRRRHDLPALPDTASPLSALTDWIDLFIDFLITKRGLASALRSDSAAFETLHAYFLDRLVPVCAQLLEAAAAAGEIVPDVEAYGLMRGIGNICIGADTDTDYDARRLVQLLIAGLRPQ
jgi:hypothetical protein